MIVPEKQREFAIEVVSTLRDAGYQSLWAGGCVRDQLLGKLPKDYDVATSAVPEQVREVFGKRRTLAVGAAFGVIVVLGNKQQGQIDVATFRTDISYSDGRRPDEVRFSSPEQDATRRDFTINGLFYDPIDSQVIDYVGGEVDIARKIIRAIGEPDARFAEDRLRMLRAVRFAATLGFDIDSPTAEAVRKHAAAINEVSPERIGVEMHRMLSDSSRGLALELLHSTQLLGHVLKPLADSEANEIRSIQQRIGKLKTKQAPVALAAMLADSTPPREVAAAGRDLRWTNKESQQSAWLVENSLGLDAADQRPWSEIQPLLANEWGTDLVELRAAIVGHEDDTHTFCLEKLSLPSSELDPPPFVEGADLIAAGLRPGPKFKELLTKARAAQLDRLVSNKASTLRYLGLEAP